MTAHDLALWRTRALLVEQTRIHEFIKLEDCRPPGASIHQVLAVLKEAGMERVGTWWTPGEGTYDWLVYHLYGVESYA
jgi:hypothetical protein